MKATTAKSKIKRSSLPADVHLAGVRDVKCYLRNHADLAAIVPAICLRAREEFGSRAELTLQVNNDQEIDDPFLILCVRLAAYPANVRKRIDAVWEHFEEALGELSGWLILTTDFRKVQDDGV